MVKRKLVWDKQASQELKEIFDYLKEKSIPSARKVKKSILQTTKELSEYPEIYQLDRFKKGNVNDYRAFEKYSYRVSFRVKNKEIRILRVRHTSREPLEY